MVYRWSAPGFMHRRHLFGRGALRNAPVHALRFSQDAIDWNRSGRCADWNYRRDNRSCESKSRHQPLKWCIGQGTLDLSEDSKYSGNPVEFLQPHACCLVQCQAHTLERGIPKPAGGHVQLVVAEGLLNDVKSSVQFGEFIGGSSQLAG